MGISMLSDLWNHQEYQLHTNIQELHAICFMLELMTTPGQTCYCQHVCIIPKSPSSTVVHHTSTIVNLHQLSSGELNTIQDLHILS